MTAIRCETTLFKERSAVRLSLPAEVCAALGTGRLLPAIVTINDHRFSTNLHKMAGGYMVTLNAQLRQKLGVDAGDTVSVSIELDEAPRTVEMPPDLAEALAAAGRRGAFDKLTLFRQTEMVKSVTGAKQPQTRARRIAKAVADLAGG